MATKTKFDPAKVTVKVVGATVVVDSEWGRKINEDIRTYRDVKNEATRLDKELADNVKAVLGDAATMVTEDGATIFTAQEVVYTQTLDRTKVENLLAELGLNVADYLAEERTSRKLIPVTPGEAVIPEARKG